LVNLLGFPGSVTPAVLELVELSRRELDGDVSSHATKSVLAALTAVVSLVVGYLTFGNSGLRGRLHAALAATGEGVATAAGIGHLIGGSDTHALVELSRQTLRAVRLDEIGPEHLATNTPAAAAFARSHAAAIGSIDVRAAGRGWTRCVCACEVVHFALARRRVASYTRL
jgi:hypothetical protein